MDEFINDILAQSGATTTADPEIEAQLRQELSERAATLINRRLIDALSENDTSELDKLLDDRSDDVEAFQQFIADKLPNKDQIVAAALYEFKVLYLGTDA